MNILLSGRFWISGPVAFILAMLVMLGMAIWFPKGAASIDNIVLPLVIFPLIWAIIFFYAYLDKSLKRVAIVFSVLGCLHIALLVSHFMKGAGS